MYRLSPLLVFFLACALAVLVGWLLARAVLS